MFEYLIIIIITTFIVSIITENMVIKRLQLSPGVEITNGRCKLKESIDNMCINSGFILPQNQTQTKPKFNENYSSFYRPFLT